MDEHKKGFLSETFNLRTLAKVALWSIPMFFIFGYFDNMIFDPLFFDVIHSPTPSPEMSQWKSALINNLGWMHELSGFTGEGGFFKTEVGQWFLDKYGGEFDIASGYGLPETIAQTPVTTTPTPTPTPLPNTGSGGLTPLTLAPPA